MGVDLQLCVVDHCWEGDYHTFVDLPTERDYTFYTQFKDLGRRTGQEPVLTPRVLPKPWKHTATLPAYTTCAYDAPLEFVLAKDFKQVSGFNNMFNEAAVAYIRALPEDTMIILYWT